MILKSNGPVTSLQLLTLCQILTQSIPLLLMIFTCTSCLSSYSWSLITNANRLLFILKSLQCSESQCSVVESVGLELMRFGFKSLFGHSQGKVFWYLEQKNLEEQQLKYLTYSKALLGSPYTIRDLTAHNYNCNTNVLLQIVPLIMSLVMLLHHC